MSVPALTPTEWETLVAKIPSPPKEVPTELATLPAEIPADVDPVGVYRATLMALMTQLKHTAIADDASAAVAKSASISTPRRSSTGYSRRK